MPRIPEKRAAPLPITSSHGLSLKEHVTHPRAKVNPIM